MEKYKLFIKSSKCNLFLERVAFLGHIVSADGLSVDPSKISIVREWPMPRSVKDVQAFLGLANYYRRFYYAFWRLLPL